MSDILSFVVVEHIQFFHGALQLLFVQILLFMLYCSLVNFVLVRILLVVLVLYVVTSVSIVLTGPVFLHSLCIYKGCI